MDVTRSQLKSGDILRREVLGGRMAKGDEVWAGSKVHPWSRMPFKGYFRPRDCWMVLNSGYYISSNSFFMKFAHSHYLGPRNKLIPCAFCTTDNAQTLSSSVEWRRWECRKLRWVQGMWWNCGIRHRYGWWYVYPTPFRSKVLMNLFRLVYYQTDEDSFWSPSTAFLSTMKENGVTHFSPTSSSNHVAGPLPSFHNEVAAFIAARRPPGLQLEDGEFLGEIPQHGSPFGPGPPSEFNSRFQMRNATVC